MKEWLQALKLGEWSKWMTGQGPMPDKKSRLVMGGVSAAVAVLVIGLVVASGDLGSTPHKESAAAKAAAAAAAAAATRVNYNPNAADATPAADSDSSGTGTSDDSGNSGNDSTDSGNPNGAGNSTSKAHSSGGANSAAATTLPTHKEANVYTRADRQAAKKVKLWHHRRTTRSRT